MINECKTTTINDTKQIPGVMPWDSNIEFVGVRKTKQVLWLQNGNNHYFSDLPIKYFNLIKDSYLKDNKAIIFLSGVTDDFNRQVELYTYYMYGELDNTPDIENDKLSDSENFRDKKDCPSLLWNSKNINIEGHILTSRQLMIIDLIGNDFPDKAIALQLGIAHKTLDFHKKILFESVGVNNKTALLKKAILYKIIN